MRFEDTIKLVAVAIAANNFSKSLAGRTGSILSGPSHHLMVKLNEALANLNGGEVERINPEDDGC